MNIITILLFISEALNYSSSYHWRSRFLWFNSEDLTLKMESDGILNPQGIWQIIILTSL